MRRLIERGWHSPGFIGRAITAASESTPSGLPARPEIWPPDTVAVERASAKRPFDHGTLYTVRNRTTVQRLPLEKHPYTPIARHAAAVPQRVDRTYQARTGTGM